MLDRFRERLYDGHDQSRLSCDTVRANLRRQARVFHMTPRRPGLFRQPYKRTADGLAHPSLFPQQTPRVPVERVIRAMNAAFEKTLLDKRGEKLLIPTTPEAWVEISLKHLKEWGDPILDPYLLSLCDPAHIFVIDTCPMNANCNG